MGPRKNAAPETTPISCLSFFGTEFWTFRATPREKPGTRLALTGHHPPFLLHVCPLPKLLPLPHPRRPLSPSHSIALALQPCMHRDPEQRATLSRNRFHGQRHRSICGLMFRVCELPT